MGTFDAVLIGHGALDAMRFYKRSRAAVAAARAAMALKHCKDAQRYITLAQEHYDSGMYVSDKLDEVPSAVLKAEDALEAEIADAQKRVKEKC